MSELGVETDLTVKDGLMLVWRAKWAIFFFLVLFLAIAITYSRTAKKEFQSTLIIAPIDTAGAGSSKSSLIESAGNLLGISSSGLKEDKPIAELGAHLFTLRVAGELQKRFQALQALKPEMWDAESQSWRKPSGLLYTLTSTVKKFIGLPGWREPGVQDLQKLLIGNLRMSEYNPTGEKNKDGPYYALTFKASNPELAAKILHLVYETAEQDLKEQKAKYLDSLIDFVRNKLNVVVLQDDRQVLLGMLGDLERQRMLLGPLVPYSSMIVDDADMERAPVSPAVKLTIIIAFIMALITGIFWQLYSARRN